MPFHACISLHHTPQAAASKLFSRHVKKFSLASIYQNWIKKNKKLPFCKGLAIDPFARAGTLLQVLGLPFCKGWGCPFARGQESIWQGVTPFARVKGNACATNPFARAVQASIPFARVILLQGSHAGRSFAGSWPPPWLACTYWHIPPMPFSR